MKQILLTIDDAPSKHTITKLTWLKKHTIPAIFFIRGEFAQKYPEQLRAIITAGYPVGNHSYSHPNFSKLTLEECSNEIELTEHLINQAYKETNLVRPYKIIRFPFGDRGSRVISSLSNSSVEAQLQTYLAQHGFHHLNPTTSSYIDIGWDLDPQDYKKKHIQDIELYKKNLAQLLLNYASKSGTLLLHDFDTNPELFAITMNYLCQNKYTFLSPKEFPCPILPDKNSP